MITGRQWRPTKLGTDFYLQLHQAYRGNGL